MFPRETLETQAKFSDKFVAQDTLEFFAPTIILVQHLFLDYLLNGHITYRLVTGWLTALSSASQQVSFDLT